MALLVGAGCASRESSGLSAQSLAAGEAAVPVIVSCEPHQRTLVRPVVVNGTSVSQIECVSSDAPAGARVSAPSVAPVPDPYRPIRTADYGSEHLEDARVVPIASAPAPRPVQTRQVIYEERREPATRSVKKSAIIIGSSAGVGAGVGAAVGGKKGALIGAAIGGGSAAIWDQITRRKD
ncbi:MAG TPA: hypothetical protein VLD67_06380 [Vicinamibacterales bacterium]|nr:hypothetical protein [Vicinamibacterales bacterium]